MCLPQYLLCFASVLLKRGGALLPPRLRFRAGVMGQHGKVAHPAALWLLEYIHSPPLGSDVEADYYCNPPTGSSASGLSLSPSPMLDTGACVICLTCKLDSITALSHTFSLFLKQTQIPTGIRLTKGMDPSECFRAYGD